MEENNGTRWGRTLIFGLVAVIVVLGVALIVLAISRAGTVEDIAAVDVLANTDDECAICHRETTPGIVAQYADSTMAAAGVACAACHQVEADYPNAVAHEGTFVLAEPTTNMCQGCHAAEVAQFNQSRHSLPAYVAVVGSEDLTEDQLARYAQIPEGMYSPSKARNAIAAMEGEDMIPFTCLSCHNIGRPAADGSVGECQKCHLRHEFSLEQARKPETCNACHIGPDHPQWEIYQESFHGIAYMTMGHEWNWEEEPGLLDVEDFPAPTCATCHMSGFGATGTTHDVGDRLTWYLFAPISEQRPSYQDNRIRMQSVCLECHNENFVGNFYTAADKATRVVNDWVEQSNEIIAPLQEGGYLTEEEFDEPIDYVHFELWHHWGRTAKFGVWMQGPDYSQWHGAYEVLADLAELREMVAERLEAVGAVSEGEP